MGLFGNKKPKLPNYAGVGLDGLLDDPDWAYAIGQAGIDVTRCEVVIRLADATVGVNGSPVNAAPAILFGQGNTLALAYPADREVIVVKREKSRGQLQTQRSGFFQILFGAASTLDGFMFWGSQDNLKLEAPEGEAFGQYMSAFFKGQLEPQAVVGTPQSLVATAPATASLSPPPAFADPENTLRWTTLQNVHSALTEMLAKNSECFEKAEHIEKAFDIANAEFVNGVRQHEISRENFRKAAERYEAELAPLLGALREATLAAQHAWKDLLFLLPGTENDVMRIANWCMSHGVDSEVMSFVVANGMFIHTDFGLTRASFWAENERIAALAQGAEY